MLFASNISIFFLKYIPNQHIVAVQTYKCVGWSAPLLFALTFDPLCDVQNAPAQTYTDLLQLFSNILTGKRNATVKFCHVLHHAHKHELHKLGDFLEKTICMNKNYNYLTTIFRSILTQIYVFLVLFTSFHFDLEKFISKTCKYFFFYQEFVHLGRKYF